MATTDRRSRARVYKDGSSQIDVGLTTAQAEAVFGAAPVNAITWKSTPLRDTVMRRTASGRDLVAGGYRRLLLGHRPD